MADNKIKLTLIRSPHGAIANHRVCVKALGLRRMHHSVEVVDSPAVRGLINKVRYLLEVDGVRIER